MSEQIVIGDPDEVVEERFIGKIEKFYLTTPEEAGIDPDVAAVQFPTGKILRIVVKNLSREMPFDYTINYPWSGEIRKNSKLWYLAKGFKTIKVQFTAPEQVQGGTYWFVRKSLQLGQFVANNQLIPDGIPTPEEIEVASAAKSKKTSVAVASKSTAKTNVNHKDDALIEEYIKATAVGMTLEQFLDGAKSDLGEDVNIDEVSRMVMKMRMKNVLSLKENKLVKGAKYG